MTPDALLDLLAQHLDAMLRSDGTTVVRVPEGIAVLYRDSRHVLIRASPIVLGVVE